MNIYLDYISETPCGTSSPFDPLNFNDIDSLKDKLLELFETQEPYYVSFDVYFEDSVLLTYDRTSEYLNIYCDFDNGSPRRIALFRGHCDFYDMLHSLEEYALIPHE